MSKILVCGGAGYIGGCLCDLMRANGLDATVYDNLVYEDRFLKKIPFIYGDIRDRQKLSRILPNFEQVVWLAAIVGDGACAIDPFLSQCINADTVKWLVENYKGKIVFTSTCSVYGINNDLIDEKAIPNPLSVYASTKLEAEKYLQDHPDHLIFRLGTLYGLGDDHSRVRFDLVVNILTKKATVGEPLTVFGGEQWRPILHVHDVAEAILHGIKNNINGLFNLHSENYRIREIADEIVKMVPGATVKYQDICFEDARNYRVTSEAYRQLGWQPRVPISQGILEIHKLIQEKRLKDVQDNVYSNVDYLKTIRSSDWVK